VRPALAAIAAALALTASAAAAQPIAIVHARAWTMDAPLPVEDATIVIDGPRIVSVQAHAAAPAGATVIDAAGHPVTPGLMNAATQIGLTEVSSAAGTRDLAAPGGDLGAAFDVSRGLNPDSVLVELARSDGLTRAVSFPNGSGAAPYDGLAAALRLRDGPDILDHAGAALFVTIGGNAWPKLGARGAQWQVLRLALEKARPVAAEKGADKPPTGGAAVLRRVLAGELPLAILTHRESDIRQAIQLAADFHVRVVIVGAAEAWRCADALAAAHIPVVLDPDSNLPYTFDQLGARQTNAAILAKAGVTVAFGLVGAALEENYNAGLALREGAGIAVSNGLPYLEGLKAITVNPLAIYEPGAAAGRLAPGQAADVVVWDGDPLEPSTNATAVIVDGRPAHLKTRQDALAERYLDPAR
jgi:imidazolonepropionase-like amidohydrolase